MSLLYAPAESPAELLARLHLHAVLPAFEDLLEYSEAAKAIVGERCFSLRMRAGGLVSDLSFEAGVCRVLEAQQATPSVVLHYLSCEQLNNQFTGRGLALPLPLRGVWRIGDLRTFVALSDCLKATLLPDVESVELTAPTAVICHLQLSVSVALAATAILIEHEAFARSLFAGLGDWMVSLRVEETEVAGWLRHERGRLSWGRGMPKARASAELVFDDATVALQALTGDLDNYAAVNRGAIRVGGLAPLAEKVGLVMDRVSGYLDA